MLLMKAGIHKMLVRKANREGSDQRSSLIWVCAVCLGHLGKQLVFKILEHLLYLKYLDILTLYLLLWSADNFANSLDPDQGCQTVGPDLDTLLFLKECIEKVNIEKNQRMTKKHAKLPSMQRDNPFCIDEISHTNQLSKDKIVNYIF